MRRWGWVVFLVLACTIEPEPPRDPSLPPLCEVWEAGEIKTCRASLVDCECELG